MKTKSSGRRVFSIVLSAALLLGSCMLSSCSNKSKNFEAKKKASEGAVENYLIYLTKGKFDKLSRYTDKEYDPFQNLEALYGRSQAELWATYLSKMKFDIKDFFLVEDIDDATDVDVTVKVIDAKKALAASSSTSLSDLCDAVSKCDSYKKINTTIELTCSEDGKKCSIDNTQVLFDQINEEFKQLAAYLPGNSGNSDFERYLDEFMTKLTASDFQYLSCPDFDTSVSNPYGYDYSFEGFYRAMASYITYEIEVKDVLDNSADFVVHIHKKDERSALKSFFDDPQNMIPLLENVLMVSVSWNPAQAFIDATDFFDYGSLVPSFQEELKSAMVTDLDVEGIIMLDEDYMYGYRIIGDFEDALPVLDISEFMEDKDDDYAYEAYRSTLFNLNSNGQISDKDYERFMRLFGKNDYDPADLEKALEAHGFTTDSNQGGRAYSSKDYLKENIRVVIDYSEDPIDAMDEGLEHLQDIAEDLSYGSLQGDISGGWVYGEFRGQDISEDEPIEVYYIHSGTKSYLVSFIILNPSDKDIEEVKAFLEEMDLD